MVPGTLVADRFFAVTFVGDYVHVWGIPSWGPWEGSGVQFRDEPSLDLSLKLAPADRERKIRTRSELDAVVHKFLKAPTSLTLTLWVPERLIGQVRRLWEKPLTFRTRQRAEPRSFVGPYR